MEKKNDGMSAYAEAVKSGLYAKKTGLVGKYDNVRKYWEDDTTRMFLRPFVGRLIERSQERMRRLRIMDLGCGSADGFELLSGLRKKDPNLHSEKVDLLPPEFLGCYKGVDLSPALLQQAAEIYGANSKMVFQKADFTKGLPLEEGEELYDFYFTSFGTCSHHNDDETLIDLLAEIAGKTEDYALIMCDWLGRYSYEWQTLWTNDFSEYKNMDYVVSYIYEEEERKLRRDELEHLTLRLMSKQEAEHIISEASRRAKVEIKCLKFFERSIFTGRHMDTGEYNLHSQSIRQAVNSLHETNYRTDLHELLVDYVPMQGFDFLNRYFEYLQMCWNSLVEYTILLLEEYDENEKKFRTPPPAVPASYPQPLREMMLRIMAVIEGTGWFGTGLPRENIIEPQLGYGLRHLMMNLQNPIGCAHGFVGILEIDKKK